MRRIGMRIASAFLLAALAAPAFAIGSASAGQTWTDGDGDGLPDSNDVIVATNTDVTLGVWMDAQSFAWTNFLAYIEWTPGCLQYLGASYVIAGGSMFPIDDFSHANGVGLGGSGFNEGGVDQVGVVSLRGLVPVACAVTPVIDVYNPFYVCSQLGSGSAYQLFTTNPGTVYGDQPGPQTGACCFPDRSCQALSSSECATQEGVFMGEGTLCQDVSCGPPFVGACCLPNGTCQILIDSDCAAVGGSYAGNDVACADANCPPAQACCFCPEGSCQDLTLEACAAAGGIPQGPGTSCAALPCDCPAPSGACCLPDGSCAVILVEACAQQGGVAYPDQLCAAIECTPTNSVEPMTWGTIKSLFR